MKYIIPSLAAIKGIIENTEKVLEKEKYGDLTIFEIEQYQNLVLNSIEKIVNAFKKDKK